MSIEAMTSVRYKRLVFASSNHVIVRLQNTGSPFFSREMVCVNYSAVLLESLRNSEMQLFREMAFLLGFWQNKRLFQ
jgi:hypothetical protein